MGAFFDPQKTSIELLRGLRGKRSQLAFSKRLGFRSNTVAAWEQGRRHPSAEEFVRASCLVGASVLEAFAMVSSPGAVESLRNSDNLVLAWLEHAKGERSLIEIAKLLGVSRYRVRRWFAGETDIPLASFLTLMELLTGRTSDWVAKLVPIETVPSLLERHRIRAASRNLAVELPWVELILRVVEVEAYTSRSFAHPQQSVDWVASYLELEVDITSTAVAALEEATILQWTGCTHITKGNLAVDTTNAPQKMAILRRHWLEVTKGRAAAPRECDYFGYNLLSCSKADLERIRDLQKRLYREVRGIVEATHTEEAVALMHVNLIEW